MSLKNRLDRMEAGIDLAGLSPAQVASLDITKLSRSQIQRLNVLHLTLAQFEAMDMGDLSNAQLNELLDAGPPGQRAWLESLSDDELRALVDDPTACEAACNAAPWIKWADAQPGETVH